MTLTKPVCLLGLRLLVLLHGAANPQVVFTAGQLAEVSRDQERGRRCHLHANDM